VPKSLAHRAREAEISEAYDALPIGDVAIPSLAALTPSYHERLAASIASAQLVVASHPYPLATIRACLRDQPLIYDAHNVEYDLKWQIFGERRSDPYSLMETVREVEAEACRSARLIQACSEDESRRLQELYTVPDSKFLIVPNGVAVRDIPFSCDAARQRLKRELGLESTPLALFVGSWHPPNIAAAREVFEIARGFPEVAFLLLGGHCLALQRSPHPSNAALMGVVDETTLSFVAALADVALNPMPRGAGTNLKVLRYLAAGVPVLTTPIGARGLGLTDGQDALIRPLDQFPHALRRLLGQPELRRRLAAAGRRLVEERFDWNRIAGALEQTLLSLLPGGAAAWLDPDELLWSRVIDEMAEMGLAEAREVLREVAEVLATSGLRSR
jgi:glycosyltransferase involved in cell wall biosynthesis